MTQRSIKLVLRERFYAWEDARLIWAERTKPSVEELERKANAKAKAKADAKADAKSKAKSKA
jgi:large subunit ribosomal protein L47